MHFRCETIIDFRQRTDRHALFAFHDGEEPRGRHGPRFRRARSLKGWQMNERILSVVRFAIYRIHAFIE